MTTLAEQTTTAAAYVVRDREGRVVVAFWGQDAFEESEDWLDERYELSRLEPTPR